MAHIKCSLWYSFPLGQRVLLSRRGTVGGMEPAWTWHSTEQGKGGPLLAFVEAADWGWSGTLTQFQTHSEHLLCRLQLQHCSRALRFGSKLFPFPLSVSPSPNIGIFASLGAPKYIKQILTDIKRIN